jgi:hypothetical protein
VHYCNRIWRARPFHPSAHVALPFLTNEFDGRLAAAAITLIATALHQTCTKIKSIHQLHLFYHTRFVDALYIDDHGPVIAAGVYPAS